MKKLIIFVMFALLSCNIEYYEPELIEGKCYIFNPPSEYYFDIVDTIQIISLNKDYILTKSNKGQYTKYKYENFSMYLVEISPFNCDCYGNNLNNSR